MTDKQIENRAKKLKAIEAKQRELDAQADAIKKEIQDELEARKTDEAQAGDYTIRWKYVSGNRFDSKALKEEQPDVYSMFTRSTVSRRFTVA